MNDMPWIRSYPAGVRWDGDIAPVTVQSILEDSVAKWPDRPAVEFMGKRLSYRILLKDLGWQSWCLSYVESRW